MKTQQKTENKDKRTTSKVLVWQTELGTGSDGRGTSGTYEYQCKKYILVQKKRLAIVNSEIQDMVGG